VKTLLASRLADDGLTVDTVERVETVRVPLSTSGDRSAASDVRSVHETVWVVTLGWRVRLDDPRPGFGAVVRRCRSRVAAFKLFEA
jgi:hypothetical protein